MNDEKRAERIELLRKFAEPTAIESEEEYRFLRTCEKFNLVKISFCFFSRRKRAVLIATGRQIAGLQYY